jgi:hypothetical protein
VRTCSIPHRKVNVLSHCHILGPETPHERGRNRNGNGYAVVLLQTSDQHKEFTGLIDLPRCTTTVQTAIFCSVSLYMKVDRFALLTFDVVMTLQISMSALQQVLVGLTQSARTVLAPMPVLASLGMKCSRARLWRLRVAQVRRYMYTADMFGKRMCSNHCCRHYAVSVDFHSYS